MRKLITSIIMIGTFLVLSQVFYSCKTTGTGSESANAEEVMNALTAAEQEEGWILMFDGETTNGWRGYNKTAFPDSGWVIEDGTLKCLDREMGGGGGDIIYETRYKDFHMKLEWKIDTVGNSGIFYLGQELEDRPIWHTAPEMQVLDNEGHPDAERGENGNRKASSLYDLIPAVPQNANPAREWNSVEVKVYQGTVEHYMNGEIVVDYQLDTPEWEEMISQSKFSELPAFGKYQEGYIGLQDHGNNAWYRNMKIKPM